MPSSSISNPLSSIGIGSNLNVNTTAHAPSSPSQQQIREVVALPLANIYRVQLPLDAIPGGMQPVDTPRGRRILVKIPEDAVTVNTSCFLFYTCLLNSFLQLYLLECNGSNFSII